MLLCDAPVGKDYVICNIKVPPELLKKLECRGITRRARVELLHRDRALCTVIRCRSGRFALGSYYARRIELER